MKRFINVIMIISLTILGFSLGDAKGLAKEDDEPPESIEIIEDVIFNRYEKYIHNFIPGDSNNQLRLRELEVIDQNRKEAEQRLRKTIGTAHGMSRTKNQKSLTATETQRTGQSTHKFRR